MNSILSRLDFGNEAGDDVQFEELQKYFFEQPGFQTFVSPESRLAVATAKKGVGKSALLRWTEGRLRQEFPEDLVVRCRGADLARARFGLSGTAPSLPNERIRDWMVRICALANRTLAQRIGFALTDDRITLVESAEIDGFKERNLIGCLVDRLKRMMPTGGPAKQSVKDETEMLKRAETGRFWLLVDDLDATFQNTREELLEMSTCFSALRYLIQDLKGVYFRASLRTDVWPMIRRHDESLDKLEQYVSEIDWSREDFRGILGKRIRAQLESLHVGAPRTRPHASIAEVERAYINQVMDDEMEWAEKMVPNYQVIYTLSYQRPRWGIQLCKLAQARAVAQEDATIHKFHIDEVWGEYGTRRIADLVAEHKHQCKSIHELVLAFRGAERLLERDTLFDWINRRIIPHINIEIEGREVKSPKEIARFLYRIGFIIARSDGKAGYEHYTFDQMPDFLDSRTDEDFGVAWEIHPCYREALDIQKVDRSHRARFGKKRGAR